MPQTTPFISLRYKFKFWAFQFPGIMIWMHFLNSCDFSFSSICYSLWNRIFIFSRYLYFEVNLKKNLSGILDVTFSDHIMCQTKIGRDDVRNGL